MLATLDVLAALAELAAERNYCRPELSDEPVLDIQDGRHPVLEQTLPPGTFVPNDVTLGPGRRHVSGSSPDPTWAAKSVFIRQVALLTLLAQMGSFVPAQAARIGLADRIFTRVGASDELSRGQSTFMVEMTEAANILNNATPRSLVILDEIGRGTSTYDGVSLAWAITEYLHDTHRLPRPVRHALSRTGPAWPSAARACATTTCWCTKGRTTSSSCTRSPPGSADKSYGIHVARLPACRRKCWTAPAKCWPSWSAPRRDAGSSRPHPPARAVQTQLVRQHARSRPASAAPTRSR